MIGRADIEGSKSNVAMNAWLPQASYPCAHLRTPADVPPQPNSPPDNVFRPDRPAEAGLGSKKRGIAPLPIHGISKITLKVVSDSPCPVPVLSWLFDARGRPPKEPFPVRPRPARGDPLSPRKQLEQLRRQPTGSGLGPPCPALRANPFPEVTDPFCRLPLPTLFHRPEAVHLGGPDAVMSTTRAWEALGPPDFQGPPGAHRTPRDVRCSSSRWTLPPTESFPGWAGC
ncbi:hypothetical protein L2E82_53430 [Cichorium intybus]|nr:hypothetical protein L2E82_53430 [Cichorium intybus]